MYGSYTRFNMIRQMEHQGHLPDGSSVQRHSAGSNYPFVVYGQETEAGLMFGVMGSSAVVDTGPIYSAAKACEVADKAAIVFKRTFPSKTPELAVVISAALEARMKAREVGLGGWPRV